jgi:probable rRNA maturation factor
MIEVNNLTTNLVDGEFLKKVAKKVLKGESTSRQKKEKDLSIVLVGQRRIRELNKKYRKKNQVTEVLTFPYDDSGEIVICLREVKKNAKRYGLTFKRELTWVLVHGILHLFGYDHEKSKKEAEKMRKKEENYLSKI